MKHFRTHQPLTTWFALWVLLLGVTLPLLGHAGMARYASASAQSRAFAAQWVEVCTSSGVERVRLDADAPNATPAAEQPPMLPHGMPLGVQCLYCLVNDDDNGIDLQVIWGLLAVLFQPDTPARTADAPIASEAPARPTLWGHPPLPPRAPPQA